MPPIATLLTVEPDGSAHIDVPTGLPAGRHRVLLLVADEPDARDANDWPLGFFDQTYGSCADDALPEVTGEAAQEREALD